MIPDGRLITAYFTMVVFSSRVTIHRIGIYQNIYQGPLIPENKNFFFGKNTVMDKKTMPQAGNKITGRDSSPNPDQRTEVEMYADPDDTCSSQRYV